MTPIRGIIFDKDGTLVDFEATWTEVAEKLALVASGGDPAEAARLLDLGGFDAASRSFRSDSVIAAGTNADIVALWYPELSEEQRAERTAEFDRVTAVEGAAAAVGIEGAAEAHRGAARGGLPAGAGHQRFRPGRPPDAGRARPCRHVRRRLRL